MLITKITKYFDGTLVVEIKTDSREEQEEVIDLCGKYIVIEKNRDGE